MTFQNKKILIVNVYVPNGAKALFFKEIQKHIESNAHEHLILAGDFSGTIDNEIDRSRKDGKSRRKRKNSKGGKLPLTFFQLVKEEDLTDVWRKRNQKNKDFTFYSDRHKSWSRINMMWMTKELDLLTKKVEIMPGGLSDHNPILWNATEKYISERRWIINEEILDKKEIEKKK